ncbi:hypothetical protein CCAN2_1750002 [Capnocytophaga canimorsus]|nr:hypothetical protein CCAN2_1750002 [Capnocytophaga canimorsus]
MKKYAGYVTSFNHPKEKLIEETEQLLLKITALGFNELLKNQKKIGLRFGKWRTSLSKAMSKHNKQFVSIFSNSIKRIRVKMLV